MLYLKLGPDYLPLVPDDEAPVTTVKDSGALHPETKLVDTGPLVPGHIPETPVAQKSIEHLILQVSGLAPDSPGLRTRSLWSFQTVVSGDISSQAESGAIIVDWCEIEGSSSNPTRSKTTVKLPPSWKNVRWLVSC